MLWILINIKGKRKEGFRTEREQRITMINQNGYNEYPEQVIRGKPIWVQCMTRMDQPRNDAYQGQVQPCPYIRNDIIKYGRSSPADTMVCCAIKLIDTMYHLFIKFIIRLK